MSLGSDAFEERVKATLAAIFGRGDSVDVDEYLQKHAAVTDYGIAVSAPVLGAETTRYQVMLLYAALFLLVVRVVGSIQIDWSALKIPVDTNTRYLFVGFVAIVAAIFLTKALLDYRRHAFVRDKNAYSVIVLQNLLLLGQARRQLQNFFWLEIFDAVGAGYAAYANATARLRGSSDEHKSLKANALSVDVKGLRAIPELAADVASYEALLGWVVTKIEFAVTDFNTAARPILEQKVSGPQMPSTTANSDGLSEAFEQHLKPWFDARERLREEHRKDLLDKFDASPDGSRANHLLQTLKRMAGVRAIYFWIEVVFPILFATLASLYFLFGSAIVDGKPATGVTNNAASAVVPNPAPSSR